MPSSWITDTLPSLPTEPPRPVQIELGEGFVFTSGGLAHNTNKAEIDDLVSSMYGPVTQTPVRPPDG